MWPVFVFGTGRCGSTHIQRLITLSTCCWIWGEHGGFLEPLLDAVARYETSEDLEQFVFGCAPRAEAQLVADMAAGSDMLSWVNQLDKTEFRAEVRSLVDRMFRSRVPNGWSEWGFKEIRYGLDNDTPRILLHVFPRATAIFTFRDPKRTIESMMRTWSPELLNSEPSVKDLAQTYRISMLRWCTIVQYFLDYRKRTEKPILFVSSDKLNRPPNEILRALVLAPVRAVPEKLGITNPGPEEWPPWANAELDALFAVDEAECMELFARACAQSDADFGVAPRPDGTKVDTKDGESPQMSGDNIDKSLQVVPHPMSANFR